MYPKLVKVALISASVPVIFKFPDPVEVTTALPLGTTVKVPFVTVNSVLVKSPSLSVALIPVIDVVVSSITVCAPGTVFTGMSFTELTVIATVSESDKGVPALSVDKTVKVSEPLKLEFGV